MVSLPQWIEKLPDGPAKNASINRFYIKLAALYATEEGTLAGLSLLIGVNYNSLKSQTLSICPASSKTKEGIRMLLGDNFVPPDVPILSRRYNGHDL